MTGGRVVSPTLDTCSVVSGPLRRRNATWLPSAERAGALPSIASTLPDARSRTPNAGPAPRPAPGPPAPAAPPPPRPSPPPAAGVGAAGGPGGRNGEAAGSDTSTVRAETTGVAFCPGAL